METRKEKRAAKKAYKRARRKAIRPWRFLSKVSGVLAVIFTIAAVLVGMFDNTVALFTGVYFWELENKDPNAIYFAEDFASEAERIEKGYELVKQVEAEGAALLTNVNNALPLAENAKVSLFSTSSVNIVYGGTGSANVDSSKAHNLKQAFELAGMAVNSTLWDWYLSEEGQQYKRVDGGMSGGSTSVGEAPWSAYPSNVLASVEEYSDAAIVVLSRIGGEGADCEYDSKNYLALDENEKSMLQGLKELKAAGKLDKIIVLINTSNALQVDFLKDNPYDIDATLWIGGVGVAGTDAVAEIIAGKVNPSGSLVDTYCFDNYSSLAMLNFTPIVYEGYTNQMPSNASTYMIYQEGIYVGYKYYETRYEDYVMGTGNAGDYAYGDDVAFPFGYGLSYTTFEYSDVSLTYDAKHTTYTMKVTVTNTGDVAGKETVQIYVSSPYTQYDIDHKIEKASVSLVGFDKTQILQPGESETLTIEVDGDYVASYDAYCAGTYILDAGDYYFTAATDAHDAVNNVLAAKGYTVSGSKGRMDGEGNADLVATWNNPELDTTTYAVSDAGVIIENQLESSDPNLYEGVEETITFVSRSDWMGTIPTKATVIKLTQMLIEDLQDVQYNAADYPSVSMPTLGADNGLKLYDLIGKDYNDADWDKLLDQMTFDEMVSLIGDAFHWHMPVESVQAPGTRDENGPQGLTVTLFGSGLGVQSTALTSEDVLAATFNTDLVYEIGNIVGNDCLAAGITFLYGPGANTHRTPFAGRNFEYYSEDAVLSSAIGAAEVAGIESKGVRVVIKHFALNDCEQDRIGLGVWLTEQAAREIYLRAFQGSLEESQAGGNGVMMAYTRWGTQWSGANAGLLKGIMNGEWNCNGLQITDNVLTSYVNGVDGVMGGTTTYDSMLAFYITGGNGLPKYENDPVVVSAMREACHRNLYAIANSQAMNGIGENTIVKAVTPTIVVAPKVTCIVLWALFVVFRVIWIVKQRKFKKNYSYVPVTESKVEENESNN